MVCHFLLQGIFQGRESKEVALQMSPATYRYPGVMGLFPGPPEKGGLELGPTRNHPDCGAKEGGGARGDSQIWGLVDW